MAADTLFLALDGGTEGLRAALFTPDGHMVGFAAEPYPTAHPAPGRAEQDPEDWWRALGRAVRRLIAETGVAPERIAALAAGTTSCTVVLLDTEGRPLRPALLWMDVRAGREADEVLATGDPALIVNGAGAGPVSAEWLLPKLKWLKRHEPETYAAASRIGEYQEFLALRLTGRWVATRTQLTMRWHGGPGGYAECLMARLGLDDALRKLPPEIVAPGEPIGRLTPAAADALGLSPRTLVVQGGSDAFIGTLALGVARPGRVAFLTGSSHLFLAVSDTPLHRRGLWGSYQDVVVPGVHVLEGGQVSTGSIVRWFRTLCGGIDYETLNREAAAVAPGAEGLLMIDHFQGNRTPFTDAAARGAFVGLSLSHGRGHLFRAVLEGIACGSALIYRTMMEAGLSADWITVGGGAVHSPLWLQIHADALGRPLRVPEVADATILGAGVLAMTGAGVHPDLPTAADAVFRLDRVVEPDMASHELYRERVALSAETYERLRSVHAGLA